MYSFTQRTRCCSWLFATSIGIGILVGCASIELHEDDDEIRASTDPRLIARGRHLVHGPGHCAYCHGNPDRDAEMRDGQEIPLSGGRVFDLGLLGSLVAPNITSEPVSGIGNLSDRTLVRSLRYGVSSDGRPLAPFMAFADLTDRDLRAIISFLRTLRPVPADDQHDLSPLGALAVRVLLRPQMPTSPTRAEMEAEPTAKYGRYLAHTVANCNGCHTRRSKLTGAFVGPPFGGGMVMEADSGSFVVPDITPGGGLLDHLTQSGFVGLFRAKGRAAIGSPMPWSAFSRMSDTELKAIFAYLQTLPPAENVARGGHTPEQSGEIQTVLRRAPDPSSHQHAGD
jgi:mono/diheme cytochrome c family protein